MTNDGGPAFPEHYDDMGSLVLNPGMSLREWLAGMAMQALIASTSKDTRTLLLESTESDRVAKDTRTLLLESTESDRVADAILAHRAYDYADAMLAKRS